jgi:hypothetical protein
MSTHSSPQRGSTSSTTSTSRAPSPTPSSRPLPCVDSSEPLIAHAAAYAQEHRWRARRGSTQTVHGAAREAGRRSDLSQRCETCAQSSLSYRCVDSWFAISVDCTSGASGGAQGEQHWARGEAPSRHRRIRAEQHWGAGHGSAAQSRGGLRGEMEETAKLTRETGVCGFNRFFQTTCF